MISSNKDEMTIEFIKRTKENLDAYYSHAKTENREVTLLINSLFGLLTVPKESFYDDIDVLFNNEKLLNRMRTCISNNTYKNEDPKTLSVVKLLNHMRNALSHYRIVLLDDNPYVANKSIEIKNIFFLDEDTRRNKNYKFEMTISLTLLKEFVDEIFNTIINNKEKLLNKKNKGCVTQ